jgi:hypothetical protein
MRLPWSNENQRGTAESRQDSSLDVFRREFGLCLVNTNHRSQSAVVQITKPIATKVIATGLTIKSNGRKLFGLHFYGRF